MKNLAGLAIAAVLVLIASEILRAPKTAVVSQTAVTSAPPQAPGVPAKGIALRRTHLPKGYVPPGVARYRTLLLASRQGWVVIQS